MKKLAKSAALSATAAVVALGFSGASAAAEPQIVQGTVQAMNGSGASGTSQIELNGDGTATFTVNMTGVAPSLPHAQHLHFGPGSEVTPPASAADDFLEDNTTTAQEGLDADSNGTNDADEPGVDSAASVAVPVGSQVNLDNFINTIEGKPFYGAVKIALTTTGTATTGDQALNLAAMPTANASGEYSYERTVSVTAQQIEKIKAGNVEIVVHGGDFWGPGAPTTPDGAYSFTFDNNTDADNDPTTGAASEVYPLSPLAQVALADNDGVIVQLEATMPVATAEFSALPTGSVDTGLGAEATQASYLLIVGGSALAIAGAGTGLYLVRRRGEQL